MNKYSYVKLLACLLLALAVAAASCGKGGGAGDEHAGHDHAAGEVRAEGGEQAEHEDVHPGEDHPIALSAQDIEELGIRLQTVSGGDLTRRISLPGEVKLNEDQLVHVVPRLPGVVRQVNSSLGDMVRHGEVMAVIESWELAEAEAQHVASTIRLNLAEARFERERDLFLQKITSMEDFLAAKQAMIEARIEHEKAEQKHKALDLADDDHDKGEARHGLPSADYRIIAPMTGTVIAKHISLGEVLPADAEAFLLADLRTVWVDLSVYQKDLPFVRESQKIVLSAGHGIPDVEAEIGFVGPLLGEATRTALARVVLDNTGGLWRPGLFVTGRMEAHSRPVELMVASDAVQEIHGEAAVFVAAPDGGFLVRHVTPGASDEQWTEITSGLTSGEQYVAEGAFLLKSQLLKGTFGHGHVH
jgi:cobalt-zinc-cadmium efflux system membrane fusion protein